MNKTLRIFIFSVVLALLGAGQALATVSVRTGTATKLSGDGNLTLSTPSGSILGDALIAQVVAKDTTTITPPTGWILIVPASASGSGFQQAVYALDLGTAAPATSYSWGIANNGGKDAAGVIYAVHGVAPINCGASNTSNCGGNTQPPNNNNYWIGAPQVNTSYTAGSLRLALFGINNGSYSLNLNKTYNGKTATTGSSIQSGNAGNGVGLSGMYYVRTSGDPATTAFDGLSANPSTTPVTNVGSTLVLAPRTATCYSDNFNRSSLGTLWTTATRNVNFTPVINSNRLRLTKNTTGLAGAATLLKLIPGAGNKSVITFQYYGYPNTSGSGADGVGVVLSDASVTPFPGYPGGSLGYAAGGGTDGFAGGWLGVGLDEYGNYANRNIAGPCAPTAASCATNAVPESVSVRGSAPNYYWLKGTASMRNYWYDTNVSNSTGHYYRVTVDTGTSGKAYVTVERDTSGTGSSYSTLLSTFDIMTYAGQTAIPANFMLSFTGSTGASVNNHEIDNLTICSDYLNDVTPVDHIELAISEMPLTCTPATVTVKACANAACSSLVTNSATTVTLGASSGTLKDTALTFIGSTTTTLQKTTIGATTLSASSSNTTGTTLCSGQNTPGTCSYTFADSALLLTLPPANLMANPPISAPFPGGQGLTAGVGNTMTVSAVRASDNAAVCIPAFASVSRNVKFWSNYSTPNTGTMQVKLNNTAIAANTTSLASSASSTGTALTLSFDANGTATLPINYGDAGQVLINARYDGSTTTNDANLVMRGSMLATSTPYSLCVDSPDTGWNCSASDPQTPGNCAVYRQAGAPFQLRVSGRAYQASTASCSSPITPNYQQSGIALTGNLVAPTGGKIGTLGLNTINITSGGTATLTQQTYSEVGLASFTATPSENGYLPSTTTTTSGTTTTVNATVPPGTSMNFGRFIPAGFTITAATITPRGPLACNPASTFTYLGEPLSLGFTLNAVNASGTTTTNYRGNFARLPLNVIVPPATSNGLYFGAQNNDSIKTLLNSRLSTTYTGTNSTYGTWGVDTGTASITANQTISRAGGKILDGPFNKTQFGLKLKEPDGVNLLSLNYNWSLATPVVNDGTVIGDTTAFTVLRLGRLRMSNAYGSTRLALPVQTSAQFYNGSAFVTNTADSCTPLTVPAVSGATTAAAPATGIPSELTCSDNGGMRPYNGLTGINASIGGVSAGNQATVQNGAIRLVLSPAAGNIASGVVDLVLGVPDYLRYDWDGVDQTPATCTTVGAPGDGNLLDDNPRARIRFGAKANNSIIYMREVY